MNSNIGWPLASNMIRRSSNSNTFGMVRRNGDGSVRPHQGWDFYATEGTSLYAIAAGKVVDVKLGEQSQLGAYGRFVLQEFTLDDTTYYAFYAHLLSFTVSIGDELTKGQQFGYTGNTGNASSMKGIDQHLHFEIRTKRIVGLGLGGRISPLKIFGTLPLNNAVAGP